MISQQITLDSRDIDYWKWKRKALAIMHTNILYKSRIAIFPTPVFISRMNQNILLDI